MRPCTGFYQKPLKENQAGSAFYHPSIIWIILFYQKLVTETTFTNKIIGYKIGILWKQALGGVNQPYH